MELLLIIELFLISLVAIYMFTVVLILLTSAVLMYFGAFLINPISIVIPMQSIIVLIYSFATETYYPVLALIFINIIMYRSGNHNTEGEAQTWKTNITR